MPAQRCRWHFHVLPWRETEAISRFAGHLCWSKEKAKNPRGSGGQRPPAAALRRMARNRARPSTGGNLFRKDGLSRFPPIDPVGNGNGKGSIFADWRRDERPLV